MHTHTHTSQYKHTHAHVHTDAHTIHSCIRLVLRARQQKTAVQSGMFQSTQKKRGMDEEREEQR